jgi:hypothetical protein
MLTRCQARHVLLRNLARPGQGNISAGIPQVAGPEALPCPWMHDLGMSLVIVRVSGMRANYLGVSSRYQIKCGQGLCALTGEQATSKLEGGLFTLLHYVIGGGHQDVRVLIRGREVRLDMVFGLPSGCTLVVEYDGEYWHRFHEERDFFKARDVEHYYGPKCAVVRVREYPLEPTCYGDYESHDVQVPARADAETCAQLVLLHLIHVMWSEFAYSYGELERVISFLRSASRPLGRSSVKCEACLEVARARLPGESARVRRPR